MSLEAVHAFFERMLEHRDDPEVSAAEDLRRSMKEAEAALGHRITAREWLDDRWMESRGLIAANNRLLRAVHACNMERHEGTGRDK